MESNTVILDEQLREAIHAQKNAVQAVEIARQLQIENAAEIAATKANENLAGIVRQQLQDVLSQGTEKERAIILARVPFLCSEINNINSSLKEIKETVVYIPLIQKLVFGMVGIVLTGISGGIMMLLLK